MHSTQKQQRDPVCDAPLMGGLQGRQMILKVRFRLDNKNMGILGSSCTKTIWIDSIVNRTVIYFFY